MSEMSVANSSRPDPIKAAEELLATIDDGTTTKIDLLTLSLALDKYLYSLRGVFLEEIPPIQETDMEPPSSPPEETRQSFERIAKRFPALAQNWWPVSSLPDDEDGGKVAERDAINDLREIADDLRDVIWFAEHAGRINALAALRWCHEHHLYMHVFPLRAHIAEKLHWG